MLLMGGFLACFKAQQLIALTTLLLQCLNNFHFLFKLGYLWISLLPGDLKKCLVHGYDLKRSPNNGYKSEQKNANNGHFTKHIKNN